MGRVPVEHRWLGIDRRTVPFAAAAAAVWVLWTVVVPWVDRRVAWDDPVRAGDRIAVTESGVSFAPASGWGVLQGLRTTDDTSGERDALAQSVVTSGGVSFFVQSGPWDGTPRALLEQITKITTTESGDGGFELSTGPTSIRTASGADGVLEGFRSPRVEGLIAAFVFDGEGIEIQAVGPTDQLERNAEAIGRMISSLRQEPAR